MLIRSQNSKKNILLAAYRQFFILKSIFCCIFAEILNNIKWNEILLVEITKNNA